MTDLSATSITTTEFRIATLQSRIAELESEVKRRDLLLDDIKSAVEEKRPCYLEGPYSPPQPTIRVGDMDVCEDCLTNLIDNEVERRGTEQLEKDFASYHSGTAPYPFTAQEQLEEQARIQRGR
jgi:hypothetical protein